MILYEPACVYDIQYADNNKNNLFTRESDFQLG
jgi:hypothetical protein